ncbi:MAG: DinB family protein [Cyclobacteriaceae bacterium]
MKWFDRKFNFDTVTGTFPGILERLAGTPLRLEDKISNISEKHLTIRLDGRWSIQENVGHLMDLEPLWLGRFEDFVSGAEILREADLTNAKTDQADHNALALEDIMASYKKQREEIIRFIEPLSSKAEKLTALHPRLRQPMRLIDLSYFVAEHDDHHLARITTLWHTLKD